MAIITDGSVFTWGWNNYGQLGRSDVCIGSTCKSDTPGQVTAINNAVAVAGGFYHTIALKPDGTVWTWGLNIYGQLGRTDVCTGSTSCYTASPGQVGITNVVAVAAGYDYSFALKSDGTLHGWGRNNYSQIGDGTTTTAATPVQVKVNATNPLTDVISVATSNGHTVALKSDGTVWTWGRNTAGQLGRSGDTTYAGLVTISAVESIVAIAAGDTHTIALKSDGTLWTWGSDSYGELGNGSGSNNQIMQLGNAADWGPADGGGSHTVSVKPNGTVKSWGDNSYGQLGIGSTGGLYNTTQPVSIYNAVATATGLNHSAVLISNGTIDTFGDNTYGQLGIGSTGGVYNSPQSIGLYNAASIKAGDNHTLALISNGTVWSWGRNNYGQLGNGTTDNSNTPAQASGIINAASITAGESHSAALISNGTVWSWGRNNYGQLGDGTIVNATTPVQASGIINASALASGGRHTAALLSNGTVWTWGDNQYGQLGKNGIQNSTTPVQVEIYNATSIAAGKEHTVALISNGTLWAWGNNNYGQIGNGTTGGYHDAPVRIGSANTWVWIEAGDYHTLARKSNGELWAWGRNDAGQLGRGDTALQNSPAIVGSTNSPPTANDGNLSLNEDAGATNGTLTGSDPDSDPLTYSIVSNGSKGTASITNPSTGAYTYTPTANLNGADSFTFKANDGQADSNTATISVTITAVNDTPSFTKGGNQSVNEDAGAQNVSGWATSISAGPSDESSQTLTFDVSNDNNALFSAQPAVASNGTLTYTPASNANGSATVTISLQDNGGTANGGDDTSDSQAFTITVNAVNDVPSFTKGGNQSVSEDAGAQTVSGWATSISAGPSDESSQTLTFDVSNDNNALFSAQPAVASNGALTYTPASNANGSATVTLSLQDSGGTTNGGDDTSDSQIFTITVNAVNDAPTNISLSSSSVAENQASGTTVGTLSATDVDTGDTHTFTLVSGSGDTDNGSFTISVTSLRTAAEFDYETKNSYSIRVRSTDSGSLTYEKVFTIGITNANEAPVANAQSLSTSVNAALAVTLSASDVDGNPLTYSVVATPSHGTLLGTAPSLTYTPAANYNGADSFTFKANDGQVDSNTATVNINITETTPPVTTASPSGGIYNATQSVTLTCSDSETGCDDTYYCTATGCTPTTLYGGAIGISNSTVLRFYSTDNAGNTETTKQESYTIGEIGCPDGGAIECLVRADGGDDGSNISGGKPKLDLEYEFRLSVIDKSGDAPQATLYVSERGSPTASQFYQLAMVCTGTDYNSGDTCTYKTKLGPAPNLKFHFKVVTGDGREMTYPASGYITGPTLELLSGYNILGVPRDLTGYALSSSDAFSSGWAYLWDGTRYERVTASNPVITGEGYFVFRESETPPDLTQGEVQGLSFEYALRPGWNIISNPYGGNIKLSGLKVKKGTASSITWQAAVSAPNEWLTNAVYYYKGSDWGGTYVYETYDSSQDKDPYIVPWVGYWVYLGASDETYYLVFEKPTAP